MIQINLNRHEQHPACQRPEKMTKDLIEKNGYEMTPMVVKVPS